MSFQFKIGSLKKIEERCSELFVDSSGKVHCGVYFHETCPVEIKIEYAR